MTSWNLADLFEAVVDAVADREAVVCGPVRRTYRELDNRANQLARVLAAHGVGAGQHVGLALHNSAEYLEAMLAAFKLRAIPVNVNYRYTSEELHYLFADADVAVVLHDPDFAAPVAAALAGLPHQPALLATGDLWEAAIAGQSTSRPTGDGRSGDDLYVLYTGGTTGAPKGVVWRHEDILFGAMGGGNPGGDPVTSPEELVANALPGRTRCLPASPLTHGTAHWVAFSTLLNGGVVILSPDPSLAPTRLWELAAAEHATILVIVGDAFARPLLDALQSFAPDELPDLEDLLVIVSGGAGLSATARSGLLQLLPWAVVVDGYGTSETGGQGNTAFWAGQAPCPGGLPRFHVDPDTAVLDDDFQPVVPGSGAVGHLARRGHIPLRYHKDPERTARTFPTIAGVRWSVPGDLATVEADGTTITLLGRGASSINTGGEKVFPDEVEATLKDHPDVFDAVVVGMYDSRWGEQVAAVVELRPDVTAGPDELLRHCRSHLASFKVPRTLVLVDHVERRPSGKADLQWARDALTTARH